MHGVNMITRLSGSFCGIFYGVVSTMFLCSNSVQKISLDTGKIELTLAFVGDILQHSPGTLDFIFNEFSFGREQTFGIYTEYTAFLSSCI